MFTDKFPGSDARKVRAGATIECKVDGITYTATIHRDDMHSAPDKEEDGFWPSRDPNACGYVGENPARPYEAQLDDCKEVMRRYKAGKMIYCGVVVTAAKGGVPLTDEFGHALWRVDVNWPFGNNTYLLIVANGLLAGAKDTAREVLAARIVETRKRLEVLESAA